MKKPFWGLVLLILIFILLAASSLRANNLFEASLFYYFNGEPEVTIKLLETIKEQKEYQNESVIYEYIARCYWNVIKNKMQLDVLSYKENDNKETGRQKLENNYLEARFIENIDKAIKISQERYRENQSPVNAYNFIMASSIKAGYLVQVYGKEGAREAATILNDIADEIELCLKAVPPFCLAYFPLGTTQYFITQKVPFWVRYTVLPLRYKKLYNLINFDKDEAIMFLEIASRCDDSSFRNTETLFAFQELLMAHENNQRKRLEYNLKTLPILQELIKKYPDNKKLKENLKIINLYFKQRANPN